MIDFASSDPVTSSSVDVRVTLQLPLHLEQLAMVMLNNRLPESHHSASARLSQSPLPPAGPPPASPPSSPAPREPVPSGGFLTMLSAYETLVMPSRKRRAGHETIRDHRGSCRAFDQWFAEQFLKKAGARSSTPRPLLFPEITKNADSIFHEFAAWRVVRERNSLTLVNRRITHLNMVCRAAVEHGYLPAMPIRPDKEDLRRIRAEAFRTKKLLRTTRRRAAGAVSQTDCEKLESAADAAEWPRFDSITPGDFWRSVIRWHRLWGPRTQDVIGYRDRSKGLRWSDVVTDQECPDEEVSEHLPELRSRHGWLYYQVNKAAAKENSFILLPLPRWQREFIERFRGLDSSVVFPLRGSHKLWSAAWRSIRKSAGVAPNIYLSQGTGGTRAVRKTAPRWWVDQTGSDKVASYLLYHAEVTTGRRHYLDTMVEVVPLLLRHMNDLPQ